MMLKKYVFGLLVSFLVLNLVYAGELGDITSLIDDLFKNDIVGVDQSNSYLYGLFILMVVFFFSVIFTGGDIILVVFILFLTTESLAIFGLLPLWVGMVVAIGVGLIAAITFAVRLMGQ